MIKRIKELQTDAISAAMDGISLLDDKGIYYFLNDAHLEPFGYKGEELIGKSWEILYPDFEIERISKDVFPLLNINNKWKGETIGKKKDGTLINQEISLTTLSDGGLICVCRIIDDRKTMERELRITYERLITVVNSINNGVLLESYDRKVVMANQKLCVFFGIDAKPEDLVGSCCKQSMEYTKLLTKNPDNFVETINLRLADAKNPACDIIDLKNGKILERDFIPIKIGNEFNGFLWVYKDITTQRDLISAMQEKLQSQHELSTMKSSYVKLITHELRNPQAMLLRNINLFSENWKKEMTVFPEFAAELNLLKDDIYSINKMIDTLVNYEDIMSDKKETTIEIFCSNFLSNFLNYHFSIFVRSKKFNVTELVGDEKIAVDLNLFETALKNLIENAIKYSVTNSQIEISVKIKNNKQYVVKIVNNIRTNDNINNKMLGASFYRGNYSQKDGYGLGLNIVKQIINKHSGTMKCRAVKTKFISEIILPTVTNK